MCQRGRSRAGYPLRRNRGPREGSSTISIPNGQVELDEGGAVPGDLRSRARVFRRDSCDLGNHCLSGRGMEEVVDVGEAEPKREHQRLTVLVVALTDPFELMI